MVKYQLSRQKIELAQIELPVIKEKNNLEWLPFGEDNLFPNKLIEYCNKSALHNAIITSKIEQAYGNGLTYEGDVNETIDNYIETINPLESLNDITLKVIRDFVIHGAFALNVVWGKGKKQIVEIWHVDVSRIRIGKLDEYGRPEKYFYCSDWSNHRKTGVKELAAFNPKDGETEQLYYFNPYQPGLIAYSFPQYIGALNYINIDIEISNFHLANLNNGMVPSTWINFNEGKPTDDEIKVIEKKITKKFTGTDNAGKFILNFSDSKDSSPDISTLSTNNIDKQFIQLNNMVLQNILSGHRITSPLLVGIKTEGQLGGSSELLTAYQIHIATVIEPIRAEVMKVINKLNGYNSIPELSILANDPVSFTLSEGVLSQILTEDELRLLAGYEPKENNTIE